MSPISHMQYGWWFAHWGDFTRRERATIALAGAGPDLDGLSFLAGSEPFHRYHHILFHNIGSVAAVALLAAIFFWRRTAVWLLVTFAFAMHMVEDFVTVGWNQYPWQPFRAMPVNLSDHLPGWVVQGVFQAAAMLFAIATTIWIYARHGRTPLEIVSPPLDRLLINYAVLPFRHRCTECGRAAHFVCGECGRQLCSSHGLVRRNLIPACRSHLPMKAAGSGAP